MGVYFTTSRDDDQSLKTSSGLRASSSAEGKRREGEEGGGEGSCDGRRTEIVRRGLGTCTRRFSNDLKLVAAAPVGHGWAGQGRAAQGRAGQAVSG